jgi:aminodeoxyfutalosine deaminase
MPPIDKPWTLTAHWILPIDQPPLEGGTVTIAGERIAAVDSRGVRSADLDFGDAAVLPGFVNAHTHLDLSDLRGKVPPAGDFTQWLRAVIAHRRQRTQAEHLAAIRSGLADCVRFGTTLIGDISTQGMSWPTLTAAPVRAVVFYELIGLPKARAQQAWADACAWLARDRATSTCRPGLSPHAPYSVRTSLFRAVARLARQTGIPITTHLAESREELRLLASHDGSFADFLQELGVWDPDGLVKSPAEVLALAESAHTIIAHANYLDAAVNVPSGTSIVYCPRTHAAFCHTAHPFRTLLQAGVSVALGTDSLASNPDLDVLAEARYLHGHYPDLSAALLLRLATLAGAEALGWASEIGSLTAGKSADAVVIPLPPQNKRTPEQQIVESNAPVQRVLARGRWIYGPGRDPAFVEP